MTAAAMPIAALEELTQELLQELHAGDPVEGITRAQAMMVAATYFLIRLGGHEVVAAQLRADADLVASFATEPGEQAPRGGGLH